VQIRRTPVGDEPAAPADGPAPAASPGSTALTTTDSLPACRWETLTYVAADGGRSNRVTDVLPAHPAVSLPAVALLCANPGLWLEYMPQSVWCDVDLERQARPWPREASRRPGPWLVSAFRDTLTATMGDAAELAVSFSGGLDSLCLLYHLSELATEQGRRVTAFVADLVDDLGQPTSAVARHLVDAMGIRCRVRVIPESPVGLPDAAWSYCGPRYDAMPRINRRIAQEAAAAGCDRVFVGSGADEVLQAVRFTGLPLRKARRWRALGLFLRDMQAYDGVLGPLGELAGLTAPRLPGDRGFALAAGLLLGEALRPLADRVLMEPYAEYAADYHRRWLDRERELFARHDDSWPAYSAWHAICPLPYAASDELPVAEPYNDPAFNAAVAQVPLDQRYDETLPTAYQRLKALVVQLVPPQLRPVLPRRKQTFARSIARYSTAVGGWQEARVAVESGLVRADWDRGLAADAAVRSQVGEIERWLRGALEHGARIDGNLG
jgi:hypothetical protein